MNLLKTIATKQNVFHNKTKAKSMLLILIAIFTQSNQLMAQKDRGYFNSLSVGISAAAFTTGIGFDVATPIGDYLALRAGISMMPNFSFSTNVEAEIPYEDIDYSSDIDIKGSFKRTTGEVLLNIYLSKRGKFFLCGGAYFGGSTIMRINAHTDNEELLNLIREGKNVSIGIGDYGIPIDENGNISGGIKGASFRPYIGIGIGRITPKKRLGFTFEAGYQLKKSNVYTNYGTLNNLEEKADNDINDVLSIISNIVIKFRLCGRIF